MLPKEHSRCLDWALTVGEVPDAHRDLPRRLQDLHGLENKERGFHGFSAGLRGWKEADSPSQRSPCCAQCPGNPRRSPRAPGPPPAARPCAHLSRESPGKGEQGWQQQISHSSPPTRPRGAIPGAGKRPGSGAGCSDGFVTNPSPELGGCEAARASLHTRLAQQLPRAQAGSGREWHKDGHTLEMKIPSCEAFPPRMLKPSCGKKQQGNAVTRILPLAQFFSHSPGLFSLSRTLPIPQDQMDPRRGCCSAQPSSSTSPSLLIPATGNTSGAPAPIPQQLHIPRYHFGNHPSPCPPAWNLPPCPPHACHSSSLCRDAASREYRNSSALYARKRCGNRVREHDTAPRQRQAGAARLI